MTQRTILQNKSMHKDFELIADALNEAGIGMKAVFEIKNVDVQFSPATVKECLWKPLQDAMYGKKSTTELTTGEVSKVHDQLMEVLGQKLGLGYVDFPREDRL